MLPVSLIPGSVTMLFVCCVSETRVPQITLSLMESFIVQNDVSSAVIVNCWNLPDKASVTKNLSQKNIMVKFQDPGRDTDTSLLLRTDYHRIAVIVDLQCERSFLFLSYACKNNCLKLQHHWLMLVTSDLSLNGLKSEQEPLITALESLPLAVDSQVFLAHQGSDLSHVLLQEVYRIRPYLPLVFTPLLEWSSGQLLPPKLRRDNYGGISINAATVVIDDVWENFFDMRYKHINSLGKCNYMLMLLVSQMLNFTVNLTLTNTWGFPKKGTSCYDGVVGLLQCGDTEIGALAILYKESRMDRIDYAGETFVFGLSFKFLKPSLSEVSIIYTLPFSRSVWVTYTITGAILSVALYATQKVESWVNPSRTGPPLLFGDTALNSLAVMCAEGSPRSPENLSSRIVFLFLLLLSLFLTTSYSAIIVSLLQTPSNAINTLTELINSPFKLSMKDIAYNTKYVNDTTNPEIRRMFYQKLYTRPHHQAFTTEEIGVKNLRKGLYAFYAGSEAYKIMSDTYEEYEKCRLKEISINPSNVLAFPVKKGSPYREHITQKARWLKEAGMVDREYKRWFTQKPKCDANSQGFVSVRIKDFYPTLVVLLIGIICSTILFILEFVYHKIKYGTYWPRDSTTSQGELVNARHEKHGN